MMSRVVILLLLSAAGVWAQQTSVLCTVSAVPTLVRLEGLAERVGDLLLTCSGGTPNANLAADLTLISQNGNITNKVQANGSVDIVITANNGSGETILSAQAFPTGNNQITIAGVQLTLSPSGSTSIRVTNLRIAPPADPDQTLKIVLASYGGSPLRIDTTPITVGLTQRGLLASYATTFVCTQSPLPAATTFDAFLAAGVRFSSLRVTEGYSDSFQRKLPLADQGTRIVIRYAGFPAGARIFTPLAVVGSSGSTPTSAGDLGLPVSGGRYLSTSSGQLVLSRIQNPDSQGAGGGAMFTPTGGLGSFFDFNELAEVPLVNGAGVAVYEVMDSVGNVRESAQIPTFLALGTRPEGGSIEARVSLSLGPVSTVAVAAGAVPAPRYRDVAPPPDCAALGDCNSPYFPKLLVDSDDLTYDVIIGAAPVAKYIRIQNDGGGVLSWTARLTYKNGGGWLRLDPASGLNNGTVRLDASAPAGTPAGTYEATLTIDGGPIAGSRSATVKMVARTFDAPSLPEISAIGHAAYQPGGVVAGSLASLYGKNLEGTEVRLLVQGVEAAILYRDGQQINFEVPSALAGLTAATAVVTVDGRSSAAAAVVLAAANPGIFPGAVLNQDYSVNTPSSPADTGTYIQIYATGLGAGPVTAKLHDRILEFPAYAGAAPGFIGVQQVNLLVPIDLPTMTTEVLLCSAGVCGRPQPLSLRHTGQ